MYQSRGIDYIIQQSSPLTQTYQKNITYHTETILPQTQPIFIYANQPKPTYNSYNTETYITNTPQITYTQTQNMFLKPDRPRTKFINATQEIQDLVEETFLKLTNQPLQDVIIQVCTPDQMSQVNPKWHPGILGFAINHMGIQPGEIFVCQDFLDRLLITIGHELGHLFSLPLKSRHCEEAKAFAFEFAWVQTIKENNIGNLAQSLTIPLPAQNGLHDAAFGFVVHHLKQGIHPWNLHKHIASGKTKLEDIIKSMILEI